MAHEATDLEPRKSIQIRSNARQLPLHLRMHGGRIVFWINDVSDASEDEAGGILESCSFELPDPRHEDVTGAHGSSNKPTGLQAALNFERPACVADQYTFPRRMVCGQTLGEAVK